MKSNTCLICAASDVAGDAQNENLLARHLVTAAQGNAERVTETSWVCNGSGFPPAVGGEVDATRRYAIQKYRHYDRQATALRQKLIDGLQAANWRVGDVVKHFAATVTLAEKLAQLWRDAARASSFLAVVKVALGKLMPNPASSTAIDRAIEEIDAIAARQFMVEVRREIERSYPKGLNADQVALILFDI
jgi:hypothetical protein